MFSLSIKQNVLIFIIWLFTISGIVGILTDEYSSWFLSLTPLNLLLNFLIIVISIKFFNTKTALALSIPFVLGFITEALGVNYGLIFGNYSYGENLGYKLAGVPIIICFNWAMLTVITADLAKRFFKNIFLSAFLAAFFMVAIDFIIEISAPRFDFWEFENGIVPIQNYVGWLVTAFAAHLGYQFFKIETNKVISYHILFSMVVFFGVFLFV